MGNARTAVLNHLLARHAQGTFILRIEDTDVARSEDAFVTSILDDLRWLGISWDEGPYLQSERVTIYREHADVLLASGKAYTCFCSKEALEHERAEALRRNRAPRYSGRCRELSPGEREAMEHEGRPHVVRVRAEANEVRFCDVMHGEVNFPRDHIDDFILMRQDGLPSYNFAAAVDDMSMGITDVVRGSDHLSNTPKQMMLFSMFGRQAPRYAHHGLLAGPDRKPLSKRHGATTIAEFRNIGILPEALVNYLAVIGRSVQKEFLTRQEMVSGFSLESFSGSDSLFDMSKLLWFNAAYLRELPVERILSELGLPQPFGEKVALLRENAQTLQQLKELLGMFESSTVHEEALDYLARMKKLDISIPLLAEIVGRGDGNSFEELYESLEKGSGLPKRDLMMLLRIAFTGRKSGPPLKDVFRLIPGTLVAERVAWLQKRFGTSVKG